MNPIEDQDISDINITPFVDVLLVLLIIFIVSAPALVFDLKVQVPKVSQTDKLTASTPEPNKVLVDKSKKIKLNGNEIDRKSLLNFLNENSEAKLNFLASEDLSYGFVADLISDIRNQGVTNIALLIQKK